MRSGSGRPFGPVDGAFATVGFAFAISNYGDNESFIKDVTETIDLANNGADILTRGIDTVVEFGQFTRVDSNVGHAITRFADEAALPLRYSRFAGRLVPGVGAALNAVATTDSVVSAVRDPSGGTVLRAIGDSISLLASIPGTFPPAKPLTAAFELVGIALSEAGTYWAEAGLRDELNAEQQAILEHVFEGQYPELRAELGEEQFKEAVLAMAFASTPTSGDVADRANLDTEQILRLFDSVPESNEVNALAVLDYAELHGIESNEFIEFSQQLNRELSGYHRGTTTLLNVAADIGLNPEQLLTVAAELDQPSSDTFASNYTLGADSIDPEHLREYGILQLEAAGINFDELGIDV